MLDAARATCDYYIELPRVRTECRTGIRALQDLRCCRIGDHGLPIHSTIASRWIVQRRRSLRRASFARSFSHHQRPGGGALLAGRTSRGANTVRSADRTSVSGIAPGTAAPFRLSLAQWMGLCSRGRRVPRGESSQWGDYHAREVALYLMRIAKDQPYLAFYGPPQRHA